MTKSKEFSVMPNSIGSSHFQLQSRVRVWNQAPTQQFPAINIFIQQQQSQTNQKRKSNINDKVSTSKQTLYSPHQLRKAKISLETFIPKQVLQKAKFEFRSKWLALVWVCLQSFAIKVMFIAY